MNAIELLKKIGLGEKLSLDESKFLFTEMMKGSLSDAQIAAILTAMTIRGESSDEIAGALYVMNHFKTQFKHNKDITIDTCGTGGTGKSTMNVSSALALILSSMGVPVIKHGNSAQSSKVGSADIYKKLGIPIDLDINNAQNYFDKHSFVFLFAPLYHPALKYAGKVRKELKFRTIFNFLGPLANPGNADYQIIGVSQKEKLPLLALALEKLGKKNIILYASLDGYDELSSNEKTLCYELTGTEIKEYTLNPADYFEPFAMPKVENNEQAEEFFMKGITGEDDQITTLLAYNGALALKVLKKTNSIEEGIELIKKHIQSGKVIESLNFLRSPEALA